MEKCFPLRMNNRWIALRWARNVLIAGMYGDKVIFDWSGFKVVMCMVLAILPS